MLKFLSPLLNVGIASMLTLAVSIDKARAHGDPSAEYHAEEYPMHKAAEDGNMNAVNHFLSDEHEFDAPRIIGKHGNLVFPRMVDAKTKYGSTPLHWAAGAGRWRAVARLLEAGAEVNAQNKNGHTPLHWAARNGHMIVINHLLESGADASTMDNKGETPQDEAAANGHLVVVSRLKDAVASANSPNSRDDNFDKYQGERYPLHKAADNGDLAAVKHFLINRGISANALGVNGETPMHRAVHRNHEYVVSALLAAGAEVNAKNLKGFTPLHWAASTPIASMLLVAGANVNAKSNNGATPLHGAAHEGRLNTANHLLTAGAKVNAQDNVGETPLHWAVHQGHLNIVIRLLEVGADVNVKNKDGQTPQHIASIKGHMDIVNLLKPATQNPAQKSNGNRRGGDAKDAFENAWRSVVVIFAGNSQGSGVILSGPNQVATNCHVVNESPDEIRIYKGQNRRAVRDTFYAAEIVASNPERDVCILSVPGLWGIQASIRTARELEIGEVVYAVGAPQGFDFSISDGIVSQLRTMADESAPLIQTSAAISPGSSGGGLFDSQGRLVGLTTLKIREGENLNFAVPVDWALELR